MDKQGIKYAHIGLAFIPVGLTPALVYALAEGWINPGGGEKDIIAAFPYFYPLITHAVATTHSNPPAAGRGREKPNTRET